MQVAGRSRLACLLKTSEYLMARKFTLKAMSVTDF